MTEENEPQNDLDSSPVEQDSGSQSDLESPVFEARHPDGRKTFLEKWTTTILCLSLFLLPLVVIGSLNSLKVQANDVRQWLPSGFEEAEVFLSLIHISEPTRPY